MPSLTIHVITIHFIPDKVKNIKYNFETHMLPNIVLAMTSIHCYYNFMKC